jgi:glucans biosynthesis protein C
MIYFLFGYLFLIDRRLLDSVVSGRYVALAGGLACMVGMSVLLLHFGYAESWEIQPVFSPGYVLYQVLRSLNTWLWVIFFLGMGARALNFNHPVLFYGREALLPFYILHQVVIVLLAYAMIPWHPPIAIKFLSLGLSVFLITIGIYELLVRRSNGLRFLFGLHFASFPRKNDFRPPLDGRSET